MLLLLIAALPATAQPAAPASRNVKIQGTVVDEAGAPVGFATVRVPGTAIGTTTSEKGTYELTVARADTIMVEFSMIGYSTVRRQLVNPEGTITISPKLYEKSQELTELQVTEYRKQTNTMQNIDTDVVNRTPDASGGSVEAVLTTMAGVSSKNELSSQYMVRGGSYDENSVYINGIEVYRPQLISNGQQEGLSIINPDMVRSVQFSTGGFNAEYGDKMSSVLDITYRDPEAVEGSLSASLQGGSVSFGQGSKSFSQLHGVRYKRNGLLLGSLESKGEYDPQYFDYQTHIVIKPGDRFRLALLGNISLNDYRFTPVDRETSFGTSMAAKSFKVYFDGQERDKFRTFFGALTASYKVSAGTTLALQASGYRSDELVSYDVHGEYWLDEAGADGVGGELGVGKYHEHARNRLKFTVYDFGFKGTTGLGGHNIGYGVSMRRENVTDRSREWQWRDSAGYSLPRVPDLVSVIYNQSSNHDQKSTRIMAYVQDTYKVMSGAGLWNINLGVRFSRWDFNKETLISPRASVGFVPANHSRWAFRLAGGLYYQAPFYKEYRVERVGDDGNAYIDLNRDIKSQRSIQAILGADYTFRAMGRPFKFSAEAYYKNLANLIPYEVDNLKVVYSGENSTKGSAMGIDMKLFGQFVEGTDSWVSFSLMKTSEDMNGVKVPRPTDQRYSFALFFTDYLPKLKRLRFSLRAIFSDGLPTTAPRTTRADAYFRQPAYKRLDVGLTFDFITRDHRPASGFFSHFKALSLGVDVFNLFDISNVSSYYWVTDVNNMQYAVPNYLTRRQINVRLTAKF